MSPGTSSVLWTDTPPSQGQEMGRDELRRKGLSWLEAQSQGAPPRTRGSVVPNVGSTHPCSSSGRLCQSASSALHTSVPAPPHFGTQLLPSGLAGGMCPGPQALGGQRELSRG